MGRNKTITYAIHRETGHIYSRVDGEFAVPVLDFAGMKPENNWQMNYNLEKFSSLSTSDWRMLVWTKKISVFLKNKHRQFWGMRMIPLDKHEKCHRCGEFHEWAETPIAIHTCIVCFKYVCTKCSGVNGAGGRFCLHHRH